MPQPLDLAAAPTAVLERIVGGMLLFFADMGAMDADRDNALVARFFPEQADDDAEQAICPVCHWDDPRPGRRSPCSAECYQSWKGYDDPREYDPAYGG